MDFSISQQLAEEAVLFDRFLDEHLKPHLSAWEKARTVPAAFYRAMGGNGWFGLTFENKRLEGRSAVREAVLSERLATASPGVAIAVLAHVDLGMMGLHLFGSDRLKSRYGPGAAGGEFLMCLGNTENVAGSDVAGIRTAARRVKGGWLLSGAKAFVTNGLNAKMGVVTAVTDPDAPRNRRLSMFLVNLSAEGVSRRKLDKQVWIPSDLTRLQFKDVFVDDDHFLGTRGMGLQQVLEIFTRSRLPISALTLATAGAAFDLALSHAARRQIFGRRLIDFQAKAFEAADFHARMEAARLMLYKACSLADRGKDFRQAASMAKYLTVAVTREVALWSADLFGAASVMAGHPIHKFPLDAWGASLGEGTQDVQKLIIFREMIKKRGIRPKTKSPC